MMQEEELQIIEKVQQGNTNAFSYLVTKYQNVVFSIALKVLKNREEAEEMAQEAFIKAYRSIRSFQGKSKFSTWLFSITYNTCITSVRKKKLPTARIEQVQGNTEEEEENFDFPLQERVKYLEMALKQLPEEDYMLIILYYYEEQSIDDICQVTGLNESNVKVKLHRARKKLHNLMDDLMKKEVFS